jgi:flagella basal body P-ring formation protein FlgA
MVIRLFALLGALLSGLVMAQAARDTAPIKRTVEAWLASQSKGLPGEVSYEVGQTATSTQLTPCSNLDVSRPAGAPAWGRGHVIVRCLDAAGWRIHVPVVIRVRSDYYVAARPILQGHTITDEDLLVQVGDLSEMPARIVTDASLAVGKMATVSVPAGAPLRSDVLRARTVVSQGQTVKVISRGSGFEVTHEGRALNNAAAGQPTQVRMAGGQVVSGTARPGGTVEINF